MPKSKYAKQAYGKKGYRTYKKINKVKKLVTGQGPTMLEKIASGVGGVASVAKAVLPAIAAINTEHKYYDQTAAVNSFTPGTNDQIILLTGGIIQGTSDNNRIGNSILAKGIQVRLAQNFATQVGPPAIVGIHCRMLLICWKENASQNPPTAAKLFEQPTNLYSPMNKDYTDQLVVLKDKFFSLNAQNGALANIPQAFNTMKIYKPLNWHMRWDNTIQSQNHIYLVLRSSATAIAHFLQTTYYTRLDFTDN